MGRGGCTGYARASTKGRDLTLSSLTSDWVEKGTTQWISSPFAGVASYGKSGAPDVGSSNSLDTNNKNIGVQDEFRSEFVAGTSDDHWMPYNATQAKALPQQTTKCPAKQVVRAVQQKAGELGKVAVGWAFQHFPQLLSGPLGGFVPSRL